MLGANDGIVSTASLIVGVAAAGLVAGAMSMPAGEYVSVSSQADTEAADLTREQAALDGHPEAELDEFTAIYIGRGVEPTLAREVATQMMAKDALATHQRDELGMSEITAARPIQAALTSATTFSVGAALPLAMVLVSTPEALPYGIDGLAGVSGGSGGAWGLGRGRAGWAGDAAGNVLGGACHGVDRRDRRAGRHRHLRR